VLHTRPITRRLYSRLPLLALLETTDQRRPMITNIRTPYSRCARSLTVKNCLHGHSGGVSEARPCAKAIRLRCSTGCVTRAAEKLRV